MTIRRTQFPPGGPVQTKFTAPMMSTNHKIARPQSRQIEDASSGVILNIGLGKMACKEFTQNPTEVIQDVTIPIGNPRKPPFILLLV